MSESKAKQYFLRIPNGHKNPLPRPSDASTDRAFRELVENANNNGDCIINVGSGYYRPLPGDEVDVKEFNEYMNKELSRARKIQLKRIRMRDAFRKRIDIEVFTDHTRKAE